MKPLILSFFAVLLGYSFFFDNNEKEEETRGAEQISTDFSSAMVEDTDTVFYAKKIQGASKSVLMFR